MDAASSTQAESTGPMSLQSVGMATSVSGLNNNGSDGSHIESNDLQKIEYGSKGETTSRNRTDVEECTPPMTTADPRTSVASLEDGKNDLVDKISTVSANWETSLRRGVPIVTPGSGLTSTSSTDLGAALLNVSGGMKRKHEMVEQSTISSSLSPTSQSSINVPDAFSSGSSLTPSTSLTTSLPTPTVSETDTTSSDPAAKRIKLESGTFTSFAALASNTLSSTFSSTSSLFTIRVDSLPPPLSSPVALDAFLQAQASLRALPDTALASLSPSTLLTIPLQQAHALLLLHFILNVCQVAEDINSTTPPPASSTPNDRQAITALREVASARHMLASSDVLQRLCSSSAAQLPYPHTPPPSSLSHPTPADVLAITPLLRETARVILKFSNVFTNASTLLLSAKAIFISSAPTFPITANPASTNGAKPSTWLSALGLGMLSSAALSLLTPSEIQTELEALTSVIDQLSGPSTSLITNSVLEYYTLVGLRSLQGKTEQPILTSYSSTTPLSTLSASTSTSTTTTATALLNYSTLPPAIAECPPLAARYYTLSPALQSQVLAAVSILPPALRQQMNDDLADQFITLVSTNSTNTNTSTNTTTAPSVPSNPTTNKMSTRAMTGSSSAAKSASKSATTKVNPASTTNSNASSTNTHVDTKPNINVCQSHDMNNSTSSSSGSGSENVKDEMSKEDSSSSTDPTAKTTGEDTTHETSINDNTGMEDDASVNDQTSSSTNPNSNSSNKDGLINSSVLDNLYINSCLWVCKRERSGELCQETPLHKNSPVCRRHYQHWLKIGRPTSANMLTIATSIKFGKVFRCNRNSGRWPDCRATSNVYNKRHLPTVDRCKVHCGLFTVPIVIDYDAVEKSILLAAGYTDDDDLTQVDITKIILTMAREECEDDNASSSTTGDTNTPTDTTNTDATEKENTGSDSVEGTVTAESRSTSDDKQDTKRDTNQDDKQDDNTQVKAEGETTTSSSSSSSDTTSTTADSTSTSSTTATSAPKSSGADNPNNIHNIFKMANTGNGPSPYNFDATIIPTVATYSSLSSSIPEYSGKYRPPSNVFDDDADQFAIAAAAVGARPIPAAPKLEADTTMPSGLDGFQGSAGLAPTEGEPGDEGSDGEDGANANAEDDPNKPRAPTRPTTAAFNELLRTNLKAVVVAAAKSLLTNINNSNIQQSMNAVVSTTDTDQLNASNLPNGVSTRSKLKHISGHVSSGDSPVSPSDSPSASGLSGANPSALRLGTSALLNNHYTQSSTYSAVRGLKSKEDLTVHSAYAAYKPSRTAKTNRKYSNAQIASAGGIPLALGMGRYNSATHHYPQASTTAAAAAAGRNNYSLYSAGLDPSGLSGLGLQSLLNTENYSAYSANAYGGAGSLGGIGAASNLGLGGVSGVGVSGLPALNSQTAALLSSLMGNTSPYGTQTSTTDPAALALGVGLGNSSGGGLQSLSALTSVLNSNGRYAGQPSGALGSSALSSLVSGQGLSQANASTNGSTSTGMGTPGSGPTNLNTTLSLLASVGITDLSQLSAAELIQVANLTALLPNATTGNTGTAASSLPSSMTSSTMAGSSLAPSTYNQYLAGSNASSTNFNGIPSTGAYSGYNNVTASTTLPLTTVRGNVITPAVTGTSTSPSTTGSTGTLTGLGTNLLGSKPTQSPLGSSTVATLAALNPSVTAQSTSSSSSTTSSSSTSTSSSPSSSSIASSSSSSPTFGQSLFGSTASNTASKASPLSFPLPASHSAASSVLSALSQSTSALLGSSSTASSTPTSSSPTQTGPLPPPPLPPCPHSPPMSSQQRRKNV